MTLEISPETDREDIERTLTRETGRAKLRTSDSRERRLRSNARRQAREWDLRLNLDPELPTAHVRDDLDNLLVEITGREIPQPSTDLDLQAWDLLVQRAFGVHEVGHIRYSAMEDHRDHLNNYSGSDEAFAHSVWNALEDGAIEKQVAARWPTYYGPLRMLRANLFADSDPGIPDPERGGYVMPLAHAIQQSCMDLWMREVYGLNLGVVDGLLDEDEEEYHFAFDGDRDLFVDKALPIVEDTVKWVLSTADGEARNTIIFDAVDRLLDILDEAEADGREQQEEDGGGGETGDGMPDDSRENHSGDAPMDAQAVGEDEAEEVQKAILGAGSGEGQDVDVDLDDITEVEVPDEVREQAEEAAADDAKVEAGGDSIVDELENMADALGNGRTDHLASESIEYPTDREDYSDSRFATARRGSKPLARILRQRLQQERASEVQHNQRRGRINGSALHRTATGESRVKQRRVEPDEKEYHAALVLDRSGSMGGNTIEEAEKAMGMTMMALDEVGIESMLIEFENSRPYLAKPFGTDTASVPERVFHGSTGGGTPLERIIEITRRRLMEADGPKFMVVVTDGRAGDIQDVLQRCNFPVIGVNITDSGGYSGEGDYHRDTAAAPGEDLQDTLAGLLNEVMF